MRKKYKLRSDRKFDYEKYQVAEGEWNVPCHTCGKDRIINTINNTRRALVLKSQCRSCGQRKPLSEHKGRPERSGNLAWSKAVKERGNHKCAICESTDKIEAHHIMYANAWPSQRLDLRNGMVLCNVCHKKHHALNGTKQTVYLFTTLGGQSGHI